MSDGKTTAADRVDHDALRRMSPDGCCHKTRIKGWPCPVGWPCPYDAKEGSEDAGR